MSTRISFLSEYWQLCTTINQVNGPTAITKRRDSHFLIRRQLYSDKVMSILNNQSAGVTFKDLFKAVGSHSLKQIVYDLEIAGMLTRKKAFGPNGRICYLYFATRHQSGLVSGSRNKMHH